MIHPVHGEIHDGEELRITLPTAGDWEMSDAVMLLKQLTPAIEAHKEGYISTALSWVAVTQFANLFKPVEGSMRTQFAWQPGPLLSAWIIEEVMRRSCQGDFTGEQPKRTPMPHQTAGAIAIGMNGRFLLADDPGAGKTQTALMGLAEMEARGRNPWPAIVVAPAGVVDSWLEDWEACYPGWSAVAYRGPNRKKWLNPGMQLLVTSWETMRNDMGDASNPGPLAKAGFGAVVFDEMHKGCNYGSHQSVRMRRLARITPGVIGATGTPVTKNAGSFWPLLNSLYPESYPSRDRYKSYYCLGRDASYGDTEVTGLDPLREPEFRVVMQGTMRRVAKSDVLKDLPPKAYQTRWVDIPKQYRAAYDEMEEDMIAHLPEVQTPLEAQCTLAKMLRLSQLAHSACDVEVIEGECDEETGETDSKMIVTPKMPCWKGDALLEYLEELHQADGTIDEHGKLHGRNHGAHPVVAFAPFKSLVLLAGRMAEDAGWRVGYITGGISSSVRTETRHAFQANELDLLCVTTGAGGVGLTLTAAEAAVFLMRPWGLVEAMQAEDRIHRRGQTKHVQIVDIVARNTIESRIRQVLREKAGHLSEILQDPRVAEELLGGREKR